MTHLRVGIVVPALNEAEALPGVVDALLAGPADEVIVVDNGSTDRTAAVAAAHGAHVVDEPVRGYGQACAAGAGLARSLGCEVIAFIDADGSSDPQQLVDLLAPIAAGADLVLGSRVLGTIEGGAMRAHQRWGNALAASLQRRLYRCDLTDLGPYRAIRTDLFDRLDMTHMTYGWPTEMTVKALRSHARVVEVPVSWTNRHSGRSKVSGTLRGSLLAGRYIIGVTLSHRRWKPAPTR